MFRYGQFCPVAKATEVLGERWTLLIVRELLGGATRFNELQRGLARASPTILAKRLRHLQAAGVVRRKISATRNTPEYELTDAGKDLLPLLEQLGVWATRWASGRLLRDELDEYLLMADVQRRLDFDGFPGSEAILHFHFTSDTKYPDWWLVIDAHETDLCDDDPGRESDLHISGDIRVLVDIWLGRLSLAAARQAGDLAVTGRRDLERSIQRWLGLSVFADVKASATRSMVESG